MMTELNEDKAMQLFLHFGTKSPSWESWLYFVECELLRVTSKVFKFVLNCYVSLFPSPGVVKQLKCVKHAMGKLSSTFFS
jgi:hypothetical protein